MKTLEDAAKRMRQAVPSLSPARSKRLAERVTRFLPETGELVWRWDALHRSRSPRTFETPVFQTFLEAIEAPTLVIEGANSKLVVSDMEQRLRAVRPERHCVLDGGHNLHHDAPADLVKEIAAFLSKERS